MDARRFTNAELSAIEDDARSALLVPDRLEHWLGLVIDLARALRLTQESIDAIGDACIPIQGAV